VRIVLQSDENTCLDGVSIAFNMYDKYRYANDTDHVKSKAYKCMKTVVDFYMAYAKTSGIYNAYPQASGRGGHLRRQTKQFRSHNFAAGDNSSHGAGAFVLRSSARHGVLARSACRPHGGMLVE
jgi:hypothetical protein